MSEPVTYAEVVRVNVRNLREQAGLSQNDLATRMQVLGFPWHPSTTNSFEQGRRHPHVSELSGLALCLGVDVPTILDPAGMGPDTEINMGDLPALPIRYARALVRVDTDATMEATEIVNWKRDSDGAHIPEGWWVWKLVGEEDIFRMMSSVRDELARRGFGGPEMEEAVTSAVEPIWQAVVKTFEGDS